MVTPGFLSDILGLLLLIPPVRHWLAGRLFHAARARTHVNFKVFREHQSEQPGADGPKPRSPQSDATIIDGEFERIDDDDPPAGKPR